jgi:hypothetical protein
MFRTSGDGIRETLSPFYELLDEANDLATSLRAKRSNPALPPQGWIASSLCSSQ